MTTTHRERLTPAQIAEVAPRLEKHVPGLKLNKTGETGISGPVSPSTDQDIKAFAWDLMIRLMDETSWLVDCVWNETGNYTLWTSGESPRQEVSHPDPITAVILAACAAFDEEVPR